MTMTEQQRVGDLDAAGFDHWWGASKYRQVIFADEAMRQIALDGWRAALASQPLERGVTVKPLEWLNPKLYLNTAYCPFGRYVIEDQGENWSADRFWLRFNEQLIGKFSLSEDAKVAAQADYERRILSALRPPIADSGLVEALADAKKALEYSSSSLDSIVSHDEEDQAPDGGSLACQACIKINKRAIAKIDAVLARPQPVADYRYSLIGRDNPDSLPAGHDAALSRQPAPEPVADDRYDCPICAEPVHTGDICATDIEMGTCHADCLDGSPVVNLDTGEPSDGPVSTFIYDDPAAEMEARAGRLRNRIAELRIDYPEAADMRRDELSALEAEIAANRASPRQER